MPGEQDLEAVAKSIIDSNSYMVIRTADERGAPWVSPVWFAPQAYREFVWVSKPEARHSVNIAARPQVAIVIFDSQVPPGSGQAVYMACVAEEMSANDLDRGLGIFSRRSEAQGLRVLTQADVTEPARHRLYRATPTEQFVLSTRDERIPVSLG